MRKTASATALVLLFTIALLLVASPLLGQEKAKETGPEWITQSFKVQHVNLDRLRDLFWDLPGSKRADEELGLLIVHAPEQTMRFIGETIAKLDVPSMEPIRQSNVALTIYLLGAGRQASGNSEVGPVLQPVVKELRERFPYQNYRLLESAVLRVRSNSKGQTSGIIPQFLPESLPSTPATFYSLSATLDGVTSGEGARMIALNGLRLSVRLPIITSPEGAPRLEYGYQEIDINTNLDIRERELVVVGKTGAQGTVDGIFLVLKADVVD